MGRVLRVPPPLLAVLAAGVQRAITPGASRATPLRATAAGTVALSSTVLATGAATRFRRSGTTLEPLHPERASALVTTGANQITRNPMYVGLTGMLLANAIRRGSWLALLPAVGFVVLLDRTQVGFVCSRPATSASSELSGNVALDTSLP